MAFKKYNIQSDLCTCYWRDFFLSSYFHSKLAKKDDWLSTHFVDKLFLFMHYFGLFLQRNLGKKNLSLKAL